MIIEMTGSCAEARPGGAIFVDARVAKTWGAVEKNMRAAPPPELVARRLLKLIDDVDPPPRVTVGDAFQTKIATLINRFLPQRVRIWGLKKYYGI